MTNGLGVEFPDASDLQAAEVATSTSFEQFASADELSQLVLAEAQRRHPGPLPQFRNPGPSVFTWTSPAPTNSNVDIIAHDSETLYVVMGNRLNIVDTSQLDSVSIAARLQLRGYRHGLRLDGDRLIVLSLSAFYERDEVSLLGNKEHEVWVQIYDVSDPRRPGLTTETQIEGELLSSRIVGDSLYLVTSEPLPIPRPYLNCPPIPDRPQSAADLPPQKVCHYEQLDTYLARVADGLVEQLLPQFAVYDHDGSEIQTGAVSLAESVHRPIGDELLKTTSVFTIDVHAEVPLPVSAATFATENVVSYMTDSSIYLIEAGRLGVETSSIHQLSISKDDGSVRPMAYGEVPGAIPNQHAVSESNGVLRIVTSHVSDNRVENHVSVLQPMSARLEIVGAINDLFPGERLRSSRFAGDKAHLSVSGQFLTVDLEDPSAPAVVNVGESGDVSTFLHAIDDDLLLGLGSDGSVLHQAVLTLFDPANLISPIDRFVLEENFPSLTPQYHLAFGYFPDQQIAVLPFSHSGVCTGSIPARCWNPGSFWIVKVDPHSEDHQIQFLAEVSQFDSQPLRSFVDRDHLILIWNDRIGVHPIGDVGNGRDFLIDSVAEPDGTDQNTSDSDSVTTRIWHNIESPTDTNGDQLTSALDALLVINDLERHGARSVPSSDPAPATPAMLDVNNDGMISALDALIIVNYIQDERVGGEGESAAPVDDTKAHASPAAVVANRLDRELTLTQRVEMGLTATALF